MIKKTLKGNHLTMTGFDPNEMIYAQINRVAPQKLWQAYINDKKVVIDGKPLVKNQCVAMDALLSVDLPIEKIDYSCDEQTMDVVYEDDALLIVNKPKGIIIYDITKDAKHTLCSHVAKYYHDTHQSHGIHYVHRLDKDTSGCCIFVKHQFFVANLDAQIRERTLKRNYVALAKGRIKQDMRIDKPIGRDRHDKKLRRIDPNGQQAVTDVKVLGYIGDDTLIQCDLHTGRTHQIRVHLASINHPLVGDPWYGTPHKKGLALHSYHVELIHPITDETLQVRCRNIPFLSRKQVETYLD